MKKSNECSEHIRATTKDLLIYLPCVFAYFYALSSIAIFAYLYMLKLASNHPQQHDFLIITVIYGFFVIGVNNVMQRILRVFKLIDDSKPLQFNGAQSLWAVFVMCIAGVLGFLTSFNLMG